MDCVPADAVDRMRGARRDAQRHVRRIVCRPALFPGWFGLDPEDEHVPSRNAGAGSTCVQLR